MSGSAAAAAPKKGRLPYDPTFQPNLGLSSASAQKGSDSKETESRGAAGVLGGSDEGGATSNTKRKTKKKKKTKGEKEGGVGQEQAKVF